jgi:hypothetical protein
MIVSDAKGIVVPVFLDVQCSMFNVPSSNMLAMANVQESSVLHSYIIYFCHSCISSTIRSVSS